MTDAEQDVMVAKLVELVDACSVDDVIYTENSANHIETVVVDVFRVGIKISINSRCSLREAAWVFEHVLVDGLKFPHGDRHAPELLALADRTRERFFDWRRKAAVALVESAHAAMCGSGVSND